MPIVRATTLCPESSETRNTAEKPRSATAPCPAPERLKQGGMKIAVARKPRKPKITASPFSIQPRLRAETSPAPESVAESNEQQSLANTERKIAIPEALKPWPSAQYRASAPASDANNQANQHTDEAGNGGGTFGTRSNHFYSVKLRDEKLLLTLI